MDDPLKQTPSCELDRDNRLNVAKAMIDSSLGGPKLANLTVDNLESTICFYLRGIRGEGKCPCDDRDGSQKYCCLELAETIMKDLAE